jgi:hypothetical protein
VSRLQIRRSWASNNPVPDRLTVLAMVVALNLCTNSLVKSKKFNNERNSQNSTIDHNTMHFCLTGSKNSVDPSPGFILA